MLKNLWFINNNNIINNINSRPNDASCLKYSNASITWDTHFCSLGTLDKINESNRENQLLEVQLFSQLFLFLTMASQFECESERCHWVWLCMTPSLPGVPPTTRISLKRDRRDCEEQRCEVYLRPRHAHAGKDYPEGKSEAARSLILYLSRCQIILWTGQQSDMQSLKSMCIVFMY